MTRPQSNEVYFLFIKSLSIMGSPLLPPSAPLSVGPSIGNELMEHDKGGYPFLSGCCHTSTELSSTIDFGISKNAFRMLVLPSTLKNGPFFLPTCRNRRDTGRKGVEDKSFLHFLLLPHSSLLATNVLSIYYAFVVGVKVC